MATATHIQTRQRRPVDRPERARVTVYLDESLADWGKRQQGGLSDLLRRLLAEAHRGQEDATPSPYPSELLTRYRALADKKLRAGLTPTEESEWNALRAAINAADRESPTTEDRERAARFMDNELARLRRQIEALPRRDPAP